MEKVYIMLCCGAGISSGLIAQKTKKAAKAKKIDVTVEARSESEVAEYFSYIDILLLGPHYAAQKDEFAEQAKPFNVPVIVVPSDIYGKMDGERLLDLALKTVEENKK